MSSYLKGSSAHPVRAYSTVVADDGPASLSIHCVYCCGRVTLQFENWSPGNPPQNRAQNWPCPYCMQLNSGEFPALLKWVTKGPRLSPERPQS